MTKILNIFKKIFCFIFFFIPCAKADTVLDETIFIPSDNMLTLTGMEFELFNAVNLFRLENKLSPLKSDEFLYNLAKERFEDFKKIDTVSHEGLGEIREEAFEYELVIGENIAFGYSVPRSAYNAFINSDDHRKNILGNWTYTGVRIETDEHGHNFYTQVFGRRIKK
ncbi:MAG: CAP domain-containing protein [Chitinophagaceae bacterium]